MYGEGRSREREREREREMIKTLYPPIRFARVEEDVFRGAYPTLRNFEFLRRKNIKTVIAIVPKVAPDLDRFCKVSNAKLTHLKCEAYRGSDRVPSAEVVSKALEILVNRNNLPAYLFCCDGSHVVGTIAICLRKLQNWRFQSALEEYKRFSKNRGAVEMVTQFVEMYTGPVKLSQDLPKWLWRGTACAQHPQIRLIQWISQSESHNNSNSINISSSISGSTSIGSSSSSSSNMSPSSSSLKRCSSFEYEDPRAADFDEVLTLKNHSKRSRDSVEKSNSISSSSNNNNNSESDDGMLNSSLSSSIVTNISTMNMSKTLTNSTTKSTNNRSTSSSPPSVSPRNNHYHKGRSVQFNFELKKSESTEKELSALGIIL